MMMMNCPVADVALTILTRGTLQIQIQFLRQRSNPTLEQTNMIFLQKIFFSILMHLDAILSQISCFSSTAALHCIEGMLIMMMMNCPVADVALMILPGGRETSHHQDSKHIPPIEGCLRLLELFTIIM